MYLIARQIENETYLTVYQRIDIAKERLDAFSHETETLFMVEKETFDYVDFNISNGLSVDCPNFSHLLIDWDKQTIEWDKDAIQKELFEAKNEKIDEIVSIVTNKSLLERQEEDVRKTLGLPSVKKKGDNKYKNLVEQVKNAKSVWELNQLNLD